MTNEMIVKKVTALVAEQSEKLELIEALQNNLESYTGDWYGRAERLIERHEMAIGKLQAQTDDLLELITMHDDQ